MIQKSSVCRLVFSGVKALEFRGLGGTLAFQKGCRGRVALSFVNMRGVRTYGNPNMDPQIVIRTPRRYPE